MFSQIKNLLITAFLLCAFLSACDSGSEKLAMQLACSTGAVSKIIPGGCSGGGGQEGGGGLPLAPIALTSSNLPATNNAIMGNAFTISVVLNESNTESQLITLDNESSIISDSHITITSNPSTCILQNKTAPYQENCTFTFTPQWQTANLGSVKFQFSNSGSLQILPSSQTVNILQPTVYLAQTGQDLNTPNCISSESIDCVLQIGVNSNNRYTQVGSCNLDTLTGLTWDISPTSGSLSDVIGEIPLDLCGQNNTWRLPTLNELLSIDNFGESNPLYYTGFDSESQYWTSSLYPISSNQWVLNVSGFDDFITTLSGNAYGLFVTGTEKNVQNKPSLALVAQTGQNIPSGCSANQDCGQFDVTFPALRFESITTSNGTCVTDNLTGLMWPQNTNILAVENFAAALNSVSQINSESTVANYNLCGYSDWRLPNVNELRSLVNYNLDNSSPLSYLANNGFITNNSNLYWSSTIYLPNKTGFWAVNFADGSILGQSSESALSVLPVRGGH